MLGHHDRRRHPGLGNVISGHRVFGVVIDSSDSATVIGNFIGTDATGTHPVANANAGVFVAHGSQDTSVVGNLISGNGGDGIAAVRGPFMPYTPIPRLLVAGNKIGTDITGTAAVPNGDGVSLDLPQSATIGGTSPASANLISANTGSGVYVMDGLSDLILGNRIGTDATGTVATPNAGGGIVLTGVTQNNTIGGDVAGAGNLIAGGEFRAGIAILGGSAAGNLVVGNLIGPDVTGTKLLVDAQGSPVSGNLAGVALDQGATGNTIGGTTVAGRNLLSGNGSGVSIGGAATRNVVIGNYVGVDATGSAVLKDFRYGVEILGGATANTIGGPSAGAEHHLGQHVRGHPHHGCHVRGEPDPGQLHRHRRDGQRRAGQRRRHQRRRCPGYHDRRAGRRLGQPDLGQ